MIFRLAATLDATLASLNNPILTAFVLPQPEVFTRLLLVALAATAVMVPFLVRHERRLREAGPSRRVSRQAA
jgi:hypothetical protein